MCTLRNVCLAIVSAGIAASEAHAQTETPAVIPGLPGAETLGFPTEEKRAFESALTFAKKAEPDLEYRIAEFKVVARDAKTGDMTVMVFGIPTGSKLRRAGAYAFQVLVHPDGKVTTPWWSVRSAW